MGAVEGVVEQLLETRNSVWLTSENVAVRAHKVESRGFVGISCTAYAADDSESYSSRQSDDFACTDLKADDGARDGDDTDVQTNDKVKAHSICSICCGGWGLGVLDSPSPTLHP